MYVICKILCHVNLGSDICPDAVIILSTELSHTLDSSAAIFRSLLLLQARLCSMLPIKKHIIQVLV